MGRPILIGLGMFTLVGAGVGICLAMLNYQEPAERAHVYIDDSMPLAICGAIAGALVGGGVSAACFRWPRLAPTAGVVSVTLLGAAIAAPLGWIAGDMGAERLPREGMIAGGAIGGAMGLVLALTQLLLDRRKRSV